MKTLITVTNNTTSLKRHLDIFAIQVNSLEEVLSSRKRDGIFYMEDKIIDEDMNSVVVINLFIGEEKFVPQYDISLTEDIANSFISDVFHSQDLPYCELVKDIFHRQDYHVNCCNECYMKCERRLMGFERKSEINAIFNAYCEEMYEAPTEDFKRVQVAIAKGWPVEATLETFQKYALSEDELFEDFIYGDFQIFVLMAPLLHKRAPELLPYYYRHRKIGEKELYITKYTEPLE